jgi:hypothetical protein
MPDSGERKGLAYRLWTAFGVVATASGAVELPERWRKLGVGIGTVVAFVGQDLVRTLLCIVGVAIIVAVNLPWMFRRKLSPPTITASKTSTTTATERHAITHRYDEPEFKTLGERMLHRQMARKGSIPGIDPKSVPPP